MLGVGADGADGEAYGADGEEDGAVGGDLPGGSEQSAEQKCASEAQERGDGEDHGRADSRPEAHVAEPLHR